MFVKYYKKKNYKINILNFSRGQKREVASVNTHLRIVQKNK